MQVIIFLIERENIIYQIFCQIRFDLVALFCREHLAIKVLNLCLLLRLQIKFPIILLRSLTLIYRHMQAKIKLAGHFTAFIFNLKGDRKV